MNDLRRKIRLPLKDIFEMAQNKKYAKIKLKNYAKRLPYPIFKAKKILKFTRSIRNYNFNLYNLMNKSVTSFFTSHFSHFCYYSFNNSNENKVNPLITSFIYSKFKNQNITALRNDKNIK